MRRGSNQRPRRVADMTEPLSFRLYATMPVWAQNVACTLTGFRMRWQRYNAAFRRALDFLGQSQWWPLEQQRAYQDEQLRAVIRHAYDSVPYYRELFDRLRLTPDDIRTVADLPKLPILTKQTIRERFDQLQAKGWPARRRMAGHTGGTTGTALRLMADVDTQPWQWAVWWRHRRRFGLDINQPFVVLAGRSVVPLANLAPPFWRRNWPMHQTYVSIHHMTRQNMPMLVDYLQRRKVAYYSGYPSGLYLLASWLLEHQVALEHPPRITVTGAETVLPHQRRVIEQGLRTELTDQYGASEQCGNISECEHHRYHVDMEFGVVEFLPVPKLPHNVRRIVCTGFRNPAMPLIRYDIGDVATLAQDPCPCRRQAPLVSAIDGRVESYVITPDGRQMGRLDFLFKDSAQISEAQLVQDAPDHLTVRIVRAPAYGRADEECLMRDMRKYLGEVIRIDLDYVSEIPREANGKFRQIVSSVFKDCYAADGHAGSATG